jgi:calcineurin-like phosphoesterase
VTADEQILKNKTAYQTDVGMTGPHDSILGRRYDRVLSSTLSCVPAHFDVASGDPRVNGALLTLDRESGNAISIGRVNLTQEDVQRLMTES